MALTWKPGKTYAICMFHILFKIRIMDLAILWNTIILRNVSGYETVS